jgi:hypothetical protein
MEKEVDLKPDGAEDKLIMPTAGRLPLFEEPILDAYADKAAKDLKKQPEVKLSANDKFVLELVKTLPVGDLLQKGYLQTELEIGSGVKCVVRSLVYKQVESIAADVSKYQQKRAVEKLPDGTEREVWQPSLEEIKVYQVKRTLSEVVMSVGDVSTGSHMQARLSFFENLDSMVVNALYRRAQQFFTAVSLLFPSDNQKELVNTLKKAYASLQ